MIAVNKVKEKKSIQFLDSMTQKGETVTLGKSNQTPTLNKFKTNTFHFHVAHT